LYGNDAQPSTGEVGEGRPARTPVSTGRGGNAAGLAWDAAGGVLSFSYRPDPAAGLTDVFVGSASYPNGYTVSVDGGTTRTVSGGSHVLVAAAPHATTVTVTVRPAQLVV